jgi:hypothetical protein
LCAVDQHVGNARRQHDRLRLRAVVVGPERHRLLIDLGEELVGNARETALGVAHRRGAVAVERPEVAGAVDERITQRERLRHAHQRLVERQIAVRMVAAHDVADDLRALAVLDVRREALLPHREEDAALDRLQAVAHVGQRARRDDGKRVVEIPGLRRFVQRDVFVGGPAGTVVVDAGVEQRGFPGFASGHGRGSGYQVHGAPGPTTALTRMTPTNAAFRSVIGSDRI